MDANQWEVLTTVKGQGNSNEVHNYSAMDLNPLNGTSYYRLKQTDFDGQFTFSEIKVIHNSNTSIQAYPNPVSNELNIESFEEIVEVFAYDQLGKEYRIALRKENQIYKADLSNLSKGIYYLRLITESGVKNIKIIKH